MWGISPQIVPRPMSQLIDSLGVKRTLYGAFGLSLAILVALATLLVDHAVRRDLEEVSQRRLRAEARLVAALVAAPLAARRDDAVAAVIDAEMREQREAFLVVVRQDRTV